jgi:hypothetical protein
LRAAQRAGTQVIWDLCHYGWPDHIDIWRPIFVERFAQFAAATARVVQDQGEPPPFYCLVNEVSYWSWAGGDHALMSPLVEDWINYDAIDAWKGDFAGAAFERKAPAEPRMTIQTSDPWWASAFLSPSLLECTYLSRLRR